MLTISNLYVSYGAIQALKGITLSISKGSIVTLIGANGAGKSTTLRSIIGLVSPLSGSILFEGMNILSLETARIVKKGLVLIPEGRKVFVNLTIEENLILGAYSDPSRKNVLKEMEKMFSLFPRLKERKHQKAGTLSGGEQQMLAVARGLMAKPKLLMMDEPSLGLAPLIVKDIFSLIKDIKSTGVTILLIEQNAKAALEVADYAYVLETGTLVLEGAGSQLLSNENIKKSYLGITS